MKAFLTVRTAAAFLSLLVLGGCVTTGTGSVVGGECKVMERPQYVVRGVRQYDQDWIDSTIEGGIGACKWERPAARPPELDAPKAPPAPVTPKKKRGWIWRALPALRKKPLPASSAPVAPAVTISEPPPLAAEPEPIATPTAPRSAIDELLNPSEWSK